MRWPNRPVETEDFVANYRRYDALDDGYSVVGVKSKLGLSGHWLAIKRSDNGNEHVITRHRKREKAKESCEYNARQIAREPKKRTRWDVPR